MEQGFNKLEKIMTDVEGRVRGVEQREAGCQPIVTARMDAAWKKIDEHEAELKQLRDVILKIEQSNRVLGWLGGLLGSVVVLWLANQILELIR
jgi:hypothetical protein